jgi:hypothetical protein
VYVRRSPLANVFTAVRDGWGVNSSSKIDDSKTATTPIKKKGLKTTIADNPAPASSNSLLMFSNRTD